MAATKADIINKTDPFRLFFEKIISYLIANKFKAYVLAVIIALLFVGSAGWYLYSNNYENNAQTLYDRALSAEMKGSMDRKDIIKIYRDVVTKYPRSKSALLSSYLLGNLYYNLNETDAAITSYREFLKRAPADNILATLVYSGLGYCYETKRDYKNALSAFEDALKSAGANQFEGMNYRNAARIYEALNNPVKALEYYKKALSKNVDPSLDILLKKKISTLG